MSMADKTQVYIYRDSRTREYFGKTVKTTGGAALPDYSDGKRELIAAALKHVRPDIADFMSKGYSLPPEFIKEEVAPAIAEYNRSHTGVTTVRWLRCNGKTGEVRQINDKAELAAIERAAPQLTDLNYDGGYDYTRISAFVVEHAKSSKPEYIVFKCEKCNRYGYGELVRGKAKCGGCGDIVGERDDAVKAKFGSVAAAAGEAARLNAGETRSEKTDTPQRFYYKDKLYGFGVRDCEALHARLYADCAVAEVLDGDPPEGFTKKYGSYLSGLDANGVMSELCAKRDSALTEARNNMLSAPAAFYAYFAENKLAGTDALCRRVGDEVFYFATPEDYAKRLADADGRTLAVLTEIFDDATRAYFLNGEYDAGLSELSRLVYDKTGRFVYYRENGARIDFGTTFMRDLAKHDGRIAERDGFLQAIIDDHRFWERVCGACAYDYYDAATDDYYDRLCFYAFAVGGKKALVYKRLNIPNSKAGVDYIRDIVVNAYLRHTGDMYGELTELLALPLIERLDAVYSTSVNGTENFIDGLRSRACGKGALPDINTYLYCVNARDRREVKFIYDGAADTAFGHARRAAERVATDPNGVAQYLDSAELAAALEYIFGADGLAKNRDRASSAFAALKETVAAIEKSGGAPKGRI